jgi:uncharacterized protein (TIGR03083 family)
MTLPRETVVQGLDQELGDFEELLRSLSDEEWSRPSRCESWSAADVAAHVVGQLSDVVAGRFDGLGTPEVTLRQVVERRGRSPKELADELAEAHVGASAIANALDDAAWDGAGPVGGTLGHGVESLWFDAYLHADDIRAAAGRATVPGPGLLASTSHLAEELGNQGWGPATLALDGQPEFPVSGGGRPVTGDPHQFALVATGRLDPATMGLDAAVNIYR